MRKRDMLALGKTLGLEQTRGMGLCLRGRVVGPRGDVEVFVSQLAMRLGPDPSPRPMTEVSATTHGPCPRGGLQSSSAEQQGDTGDAGFDRRFRWCPAYGHEGNDRPGYLDSARLRGAILELDADIARSLDHEGIPVFQIDHFESNLRMMILSHLPEAALLDRAVRMLVELALHAGPRQG